MHTAEIVPELSCSRLWGFIVCAVVVNADKIDPISFRLDALHESIQPSPVKSRFTSWGRTSQSHAGRLKLWPETERFLNRHVRLILGIGFVERQEHLATRLYRGEILWIDVLLVPDHRNELDVLHRCSHRSYAPVITPAGSTALQHMVNAIIAPVSDPSSSSSSPHLVQLYQSSQCDRLYACCRRSSCARHIGALLAGS